MTATPGSQYGALESLLHEIQVAETKLASFQGKQELCEGDSEVGFLQEDINLLRKPEGGLNVEDDGGLHYYLAVGQIEKEVKELRNIAEINRNSIDGNKATIDSLQSMLTDQREVVAALEKELGGDADKETSAVDENARKLNEKINLNKLILSDLKASFRNLLSSQMRTESLSLVLGTLWRKFVAGGPAEAVAEVAALGCEVDTDCLDQLSGAGIIKQEGTEIRLVNFSSE